MLAVWERPDLVTAGLVLHAPYRDFAYHDFAAKTEAYADFQPSVSVYAAFAPAPPPSAKSAPGTKLARR